MKIIGKTLVSFISVLILSACNSFISTSALNVPTINPTDDMENSISIVETNAVMTQAVLSAATFTPSPSTNPDHLVQPPPADRLDYAMAIAPKVYNRFPYMNETGPTGGEYSGCTDTNDFNTAVYYGIGHSLDTVTSAFERYFQEEQWAFTEATTELIGNEVREVSYEVYRFLPSETPAFERLRIIMRDESSFQGADYIDVRLFLTHIETKSNLGYFGDLSCRLNNRWLWNSLYE